MFDMRVSTLSSAKVGSPLNYRVASMRTDCQTRCGKNPLASPRLRDLSAWRQTTERFTIRRGRNFLPTRYRLPMESDSRESCSRQYGTRLFPGMGATGLSQPYRMTSVACIVAVAGVARLQLLAA